MLTDAELAERFVAVTSKLRDEGRFSLSLFLQAVENNVGGTLVLQAPCKSAKRGHAEAGYQAERFSAMIPGQRVPVDA